MVMRPPLDTLVQQSEAVSALANRTTDRGAATTMTRVDSVTPFTLETQRKSYATEMWATPRWMYAAHPASLPAPQVDVSLDTLRKLRLAWLKLACCTLLGMLELCARFTID